MLEKLIREEGVVFLDEASPRNTIKKLVKKANDLGKLGDEGLFETEVFDREAILSTGIGLGIAIPHAKIESVDEFFIIVGIERNGIEWNSIDSEPVKAVFLIGAPEAERKRYLRILSKLILLAKNKVRRDLLFSAERAEEVVELFKNF